MPQFAHADPPGMTESQYVEQLVRLPESFFCYRPADDAPAVAALPASQNGYVTFGFLNHLAKLSEPMVQAVAQILASLAGRRPSDRRDRLRATRSYLALGSGAPP